MNGPKILFDETICRSKMMTNFTFIRMEVIYAHNQNLFARWHKYGVHSHFFFRSFRTVYRPKQILSFAFHLEKTNADALKINKSGELQILIPEQKFYGNT